MPVVALQVRVPAKKELQVDLDASLADLLEALHSQHGLQPNAVKLLLSGKILPLDRPHQVTPRELGITESSILMALRVAPTQEIEQARGQERVALDLSRAAQATEQLAARVDGGSSSTGDQYYFAITNQDGQEIRLPDKDRQGLVTALALQKKGDAKRSSGDTTLALEMYVLAAQALDQVDPKFVDLADNFAIMMVDMSWILFQQKDLAKLPRAEEWLNKAEAFFEKVHGRDMERVRQIRGNNGAVCPEMVLYVRLHFLQGVVAMLRHDSRSAKNRLTLAKTLCEKMLVPDDAVEQLVMLGISVKEARRAWRAGGGDLDAAATHALERRRKATELHELERQRHERSKEQRQYGVSKSGKRVDMLLLEQLCKMGYTRLVAAEALRQADNDQHTTMEILTDSNKFALVERELHLRDLREKAKRAAKEAERAQREADKQKRREKEEAAIQRAIAASMGSSDENDAAMQDAAVTSPTGDDDAKETAAGQPKQQAVDAQVEILTVMGFSARRAKAALRSCGNNLEQASELLLAVGDGPISDNGEEEEDDENMADAADGSAEEKARKAAERAKAAIAEVVAAEQDLNAMMGETEEEQGGGGGADEAAAGANDGRYEKDRSVEEFLEGMEEDDEAHLGTDLNEEMEAIMEYWSKLE